MFVGVALALPGSSKSGLRGLQEVDSRSCPSVGGEQFSLRQNV